jgi:putative protease
VYKVSTGKTFTLSEEACRRRLERAVHPPAKVSLLLRFEGNLLHLEAVTSSCALSRSYEVEMHPALQSPLTRDILRQAFEKTGHAGLILDEFMVGDLPPVVVPPSRLKEIRRDLYGSLAALLADRNREQLARRIDEARRRLLPPRRPEPAGRADITVIGAGGQDLTILEEREVRRLVLPLVPEAIQYLSRAEKFCRDRSRIVWEIPSLIFEGEWHSFQTAVTDLAGQGFSRFRLNNLGHLRLFDHLEGISRTGGPLLYVLNSQAALALGELGLDGFTFSIEDDRQNMAEILSREIKLKAAAMVYCPVPLLTSRIPPVSVGSGDLLESDRGEAVRLEVSRGLTTVWAGQDFSLAGHLAELREMGCGELVVDLSRVGTNSGPGREILDAVKEDRPLAGTSLFNFDRGLE